MGSLTESWLENAVESMQMPALSPSASRTLLAAVEASVKKVIQRANKFQRRGKKQILTVEDLNLALKMNGDEPIYGVYRAHDPLLGKNKVDFGSAYTYISTIDKQSIMFSYIIHNLNVYSVELLKQPLPSLPLQPEVCLHWLAVEGVQPLIPENPTVSSSASAIHTTSGAGGDDDGLTTLPREMQVSS